MIGYGVLLQGGEVQHLAAKAFGVRERITTITSYCANIPGAYDSSYISNIRSYTDINVLYKQWTEYRLSKMMFEIDRLHRKAADLDEPLDVVAVQQVIESQIQYLKRTSRQLVPFDVQNEVLQKFGASTVQKAAALWEQAQGLDSFEERVTSITQHNWMPESPLWADLAETQTNIKAGRMLEGQKGRYQWDNARQFCMGDELIRQGLPELFLLWFDATGLFALTEVAR